MDLQYSKNLDALALMASGSDFTPLGLRLLESGLWVMALARGRLLNHSWMSIKRSC
ncbi:MULTISPECIES: hypothetical protein [Pseudomonas syringae group]